MTQYRTKLDIWADIIKTCNGGIKKTRLVYGANINFTTVRKYLRDMMEKELVIKTANNCYIPTNKGMLFLEHYNNMMSVIE